MFQVDFRSLLLAYPFLQSDDYLMGKNSNNRYKLIQYISTLITISHVRKLIRDIAQFYVICYNKSYVCFNKLMNWYNKLVNCFFFCLHWSLPSIIVMMRVLKIWIIPLLSRRGTYCLGVNTSSGSHTKFVRAMFFCLSTQAFDI